MSSYVEDKASLNLLTPLLLIWVILDRVGRIAYRSRMCELGGLDWAFGSNTGSSSSFANRTGAFYA